MIKVSIIVPIYNTSIYLPQCLESILNQTLKEIEIICINDGSTDNSLAIINKYATLDDRIRVVNKNNTGYGHTMNVGLSVARGEYIGVIESDDFASDQMFERLYKAGKDKDAEIVKSNYMEYNEVNNIMSEFREVLHMCEYNHMFSPVENSEIFYASLCIWSAIYKREFIVNHQIRFNETPGASYQDISFNFKTLALAKKVLLLKEGYLNYRTDSAFSSVNNIQKIYCVCDEYKEIERFIMSETDNKEKLLNIEIYLKVRSYIWNYNRLALAFQYTFLLKMIEEFKMDQKKGLLKKEIWSNSEWTEIQNILNDGDDYFYKTCKNYQDKRVEVITPPLELFIYKQGLFAMLKSYAHVIIYGAGLWANRVFEEILEAKIEITEFAVSDKRDNPSVINNIPVCQIDDLVKYKENSIVLIAVQEKYQYDILNKLKLLEFKPIIPLLGMTKECLFGERIKIYEKWFK